MHHNHVGQLTWCLNNEVHERNRTSYYHKPVVQRWNIPYSWRWWWCWYRRWWRSDRGRLRHCFPSNLCWTSLCFCVSCFSAALDRDHWGGLYIGVLRSGWASGCKDGRQWRLEAQTRLGGVAWLGAHATYTGLASGPCLVDFFSTRCFSW
jgi:hypothetical protein